jgi:hypothetical protein
VLDAGYDASASSDTRPVPSGPAAAHRGSWVNEQLLERGGARVPLLSAERFEEYLVGGYQFLKRLSGGLAASRSEPDQHPASVGRIGCAADEPGSFEPVEP